MSENLYVDYRCGACRKVIRTLKLDEGDTPMFMRWPHQVVAPLEHFRGRSYSKCGGVMRSLFGTHVDGSSSAPMVWVKPTLADRASASKYRRAEYDAGRLILKTEAEALISC